MKTKITIAAILLTSFFVLLFTSCGNYDLKQAEQLLYTEGLELCGKISTLIKSEEWLANYDLIDSGKEKLAELSDMDTSTPSAVYTLKLPPIDEIKFIKEYESMSDEIKEHFKSNIYSSAISTIITSSDLDNIVISTSLAVTNTFVCPGLTESTAYIFEFSDGIAIAVSYELGKDNAVYAVARLLPDIRNEDNVELSTDTIIEEALKKAVGECEVTKIR